MDKKPEYIELEYNKGKYKYFIHIDLKDDSIWIDTKVLPETAILCAMYDGTSMQIAKCGQKSSLNRYFLNSSWVINEWGGDEEIVKLIKARIEKVVSDIPKLKEKYAA